MGASRGPIWIVTFTYVFDYDDENVYGNKIGGNPSLLQEEDCYFSNLKTNNFDFIFQFDESSYQKGQVTGNRPFLNGIIYFYGKIDNNRISNIIVGFWQKG